MLLRRLLSVLFVGMFADMVIAAKGLAVVFRVKFILAGLFLIAVFLAELVNFRTLALIK
jgi:hypothetical protein